MNRKKQVGAIALLAVAMFFASVTSGFCEKPLKPADYYFKALGYIDEGPPVFIITEKALWDANCGDFSTVPVREQILPRYFYPDPGNPDAVTYRYDGTTIEGHDALVNKGFIENITLDQPCP